MENRKLLREQLKKIVRQIYSTIGSICINNFTIQAEAFSYFSIYLKHLGLGIGAEDCLRSVLENNEDLLQKLNFALITDLQIYIN
jgi:hypothetical protein